MDPVGRSKPPSSGAYAPERRHPQVPPGEFPLAELAAHATAEPRPRPAAEQPAAGGAAASAANATAATPATRRAFRPTNSTTRSSTRSPSCSALTELDAHRAELAATNGDQPEPLTDDDFHALQAHVASVITDGDPPAPQSTPTGPRARDPRRQPRRDLLILQFARGSTTIRISAPDKNRTCARGLGRLSGVAERSRFPGLF
jgi:hypothetical protein